MRFSFLAAAALSASPVTSEFYIKEQFNDQSWTSRWTESTSWKSSGEMGKWEQTAGEHTGDPSDLGIKTTMDHRFYGISAPLSTTYTSTPDKDLVVQYAVKFENKMTCGGAYLKLLPGGSSFDSAAFGGDADYAIMFGPDICGSTKRTHVILNNEKKQENVMITKDIPCETDKLSHLYTFIVRPDNTFEVFVDNKSVRSGALAEEFKFLPPKEIKDPDASKPGDWVDEKRIPDPESVKPEGYDDISPELPDPSAVKPEDWDDEDDGDWEAPMIDNPEYEGPWKPKMISNPDYKGPWKHPLIPNPDFYEDDKLSAICAKGCTHVGFELWQVSSGAIFDDIIVTDSLEEAQKFAEDTFFKKKDGERESFEKAETEAEEKRAEEAEERRKEMEEMEEEDDVDEDEEPEL